VTAANVVAAVKDGRSEKRMIVQRRMSLEEIEANSRLDVLLADAPTEEQG
jgi:hypothetical protein